MAIRSIVGVTPPDFHGTTVGLNPDLRVLSTAAMQLVDTPPRRMPQGRVIPYSLVERLKPGVSLERARSECISLFDS